MDKDFKKHLAGLSEYLRECGWNVYPYPSIVLRNDDQEAQGMFGKTAYYEPVNKSIVLYTTNRHPKDILRSFAHEMRHHHQFMEGMMKPLTAAEANDPKYTQNNKELRKLEEDAYLNGNMAFRDYCDTIKYGK